jgi:hypothetical protein
MVYSTYRRRALLVYNMIHGLLVYNTIHGLLVYNTIHGLLVYNMIQRPPSWGASIPSPSPEWRRQCRQRPQCPQCPRPNPRTISSLEVHRLSPPAALSRCIRATYCLLTVFQALMYFSMQLLKQPSSPLDRLVPGLGTQRSKQCSLSFWTSQYGCAIEEYPWEGPGRSTSTSMRAFCMAASCCTWRMICILLSSMVLLSVRRRFELVCMGFVWGSWRTVQWPVANGARRDVQKSCTCRRQSVRITNVGSAPLDPCSPAWKGHSSQASPKSLARNLPAARLSSLLPLFLFCANCWSRGFVHSLRPVHRRQLPREELDARRGSYRRCCRHSYLQ